MILASAMRYSFSLGISLSRRTRLQPKSKKLNRPSAKSLVLDDLAETADIHDGHGLDPGHARGSRSNLHHRHQAVAGQRVFGHLAVARFEDVKTAEEREETERPPAVEKAGIDSGNSVNSEVKSIFRPDDSAGFGCVCGVGGLDVY